MCICSLLQAEGCCDSSSGSFPFFSARDIHGHTFSLAQNSIELTLFAKIENTPRKKQEEREIIASNNYCLWKLRTFGEFFHHFTNIKRTIQTYVCTFCTEMLSFTTNVGVFLNAIIFIHNGHWNFIAFLIRRVINTIIFRFNSSQYWKMAPIFTNQQQQRKKERRTMHWGIVRNELACKLGNCYSSEHSFKGFYLIHFIWLKTELYQWRSFFCPFSS